MTGRRTGSLAVVAALVAMIAMVGSATPMGAAGQGEEPAAPEIGVTADEIRIGVIADVENQLSPGLFKGAADSVEAFAKWVNAHGGLGGRKMVVDFLDSHLTADDARNAIIHACQEDFAIVGTSALFLNNVDDMVACVDQSGAATGLPDIPGVATEIVQACSPVSFPINPPTIDCETKDDHPQTYRGNVGATKYYQELFGKDLQRRHREHERPPVGAQLDRGRLRARQGCGRRRRGRVQRVRAVTAERVHADRAGDP